VVVRGFLSLCVHTYTNRNLRPETTDSKTHATLQVPGWGNPLFAVCHPGEKGHRGGYIAHLRLLCKEAS
jgi:hypothetical protein